jgi:hypothetical protein
VFLLLCVVACFHVVSSFSSSHVRMQPRFGVGGSARVRMFSLIMIFVYTDLCIKVLYGGVGTHGSQRQSNHFRHPSPGKSERSQMRKCTLQQRCYCACCFSFSRSHPSKIWGWRLGSREYVFVKYDTCHHGLCMKLLYGVAMPTSQRQSTLCTTSQ